MQLALHVPLAEDIQAVGAVLGSNAQGGDFIMLNGPLGAGKTTLTQGIARGMGVRTSVSSPTFVIAQIYRGSNLELVHVDAYRLTSLEELDALDLDTTFDTTLTVVEWGKGKTEVLSTDRLEIQISRPEGSASGAEPADLYGDAPRELLLTSYGPRSTKLVEIIAQAAELQKLQLPPAATVE